VKKFWQSKPKLTLAAAGVTGAVALVMGTGLLLSGIVTGAAAVIAWNSLSKKDEV
jgi:hypothetical protein